MKAIVRTKYGSPDVLHLEEIEKPVPGDDDVLVKIQAASVNPLDWHFLRGTPFPIRFVGGLINPKHEILGAEVAGVVEAAGRNVRQFQPGDAVYGDIYSSGLGAFAEYVAASETSFVLKPEGTSFEEAAAVPVAGLTALQCLRDQGRIQEGQKVLINGASGGVGTFAVQIAKAFGAEVTGVCSTHNLEMVRSIGADQIIDYTREDFCQNEGAYDLILDNVGNRSIAEYQHALSPDGTYLSNSATLGLMVRLMLPGAANGNKRMEATATTKASQTDLGTMNEFLESGKVVPVIDQTYPLSEVPEAVAYLEKGHARGKVIITM